MGKVSSSLGDGVGIQEMNHKIPGYVSAGVGEAASDLHSCTNL